MKTIKRAFVLATGLIIGAAASVTSAPAAARNVVLLHGMMLDGSGWRGVAEILQQRGYNVTVVQQPLNGFDQDVLAAKHALELQSGPVILVGHSYAGAVISEAGVDPDVVALVYVAALQPDIGETIGELNASMPALLDPRAFRATSDGYMTLEPSAFVRDVANDLSPADGKFLATSQAPTNSTVFARKALAAAWHDKPSYAIVAKQDRAINPDLERWMYKRSKAKVTEIDAGHMVYISQPRAVADVIMNAAQDAK